MSDNPYDRIMPPTALDKAVDRAVEETNQHYLNNEAAYEEADRIAAERWAAWAKAEEAVGPHGVVLPLALAEEIERVLSGVEPRVLTPDLLQKTLFSHIERAATRTTP